LETGIKIVTINTKITHANTISTFRIYFLIMVLMSGLCFTVNIEVIDINIYINIMQINTRN